jgi:hypothetical protein
MGRRGALPIQTIAAGIERLDTPDSAVSSDQTMNSVNSIYFSNQEIDGTGCLTKFGKGEHADSRSRHHE